VEAESIRPEAAEETPATGYGLKWNVGEYWWNEFFVLVALDVLVGLTSNYAADGGGVVDDGGGGCGAEAVDGGYGENEGENEC